MSGTKGHGEKLSRKHEAAIAALLLAPTLAAAAHVAGIGEATLRRWLQLPEFQAAYRHARREAVTQATARLQQASSAAVGTLEEIMTNEAAPAPARVSAAKTVLDLSLKAVDLEDILARIEALEASHEKGPAR